MRQPLRDAIRLLRASTFVTKIGHVCDVARCLSHPSGRAGNRRSHRTGPVAVLIADAHTHPDRMVGEIKCHLGRPSAHLGRDTRADGMVGVLRKSES